MSGGRSVPTPSPCTSTAFCTWHYCELWLPLVIGRDWLSLYENDTPQRKAFQLEKKSSWCILWKLTGCNCYGRCITSLTCERLFKVVLFQFSIATEQPIVIGWDLRAFEGEVFFYRVKDAAHHNSFFINKSPIFLQTSYIGLHSTFINLLVVSSLWEKKSELYNINNISS